MTTLHLKPVASWPVDNHGQNLRRGQLVKAASYLDAGAADVYPGTYGIVFEEGDAYEDGNGPMVSWMPQLHRPFGSMCNVYDRDVVVIERIPLVEHVTELLH